jgi:hypothetical protein
MTTSQEEVSWLAPVDASQEEFDSLVQELRTDVSRQEAEEALIDSARHNEGDVARAILTVYPDSIHCVDAHQNSPLHMAAANGHVEMTKLLLKCGADPSQRNEKGNTPLHWASANGCQPVVTLLLEQEHVDVLQRNTFGKSALSAGFESQNTDVVQSLLEHKTASEDRLLQTNDEESSSAVAGDNNQEGVTHEFNFGAGAALVKIRELPMAKTDQDSILGQINPSDDTTGLGIWASSLVTAQWMVAIRHRLANCPRILELGSGCGVPALAVAQAVPSCTEIYATDFNPQTVANLRHNINLNDDAVGRVHALEMNWQDPNTWPTSGGQSIQVLVGSDLIYQSDMVPVLLQTITALLATDGTFFYVAPVTGRQGQDDFFRGLVTAGFQTREHKLDPSWKANCLASGDDDLFFVHFHEMSSAEFKLYEFSKSL